MQILIGVLIVLLLTAATAFFVAQEFAYVAVDRSSVRNAADRGDAVAVRVLQITSRLSFMLSGAQLGITLTALLVGYAGEPFIGQGLTALIGDALPSGVSTTLSVVLTLAFSTVLQMVLGELAPKNLAVARAEALARALSRPTVVYLAVAGPLIKLFDGAANRLLRRAGIEPVDELPQGATSEDLEHIIDASHAGGSLDAELFRQLEGGLDFRTLDAGQVMTPRVHVHTVSADLPVSRVIGMLATGRSRFPVTGSNVDDVHGVIGLAEVLRVPRDRRDTTTAGEACGPAVFVPESLPLPEVLERLRAENRQLACVVDEYGGLAGVVTFEDVAEEVVGEILDEDDLPEPRARLRADGGWAVPGHWRIDEVAERTGVELPTDGTYESVGGLVLRELGRVARPGDTVTIELPPSTVDDGDSEPEPLRRATLVVKAVQRHVPHTVVITVSSVEHAS